ncbi:hypothetical protein [Thermofilum sp.]|uniref:hypothetical protein n=1 Tax=Thermofilum sp. TaxID=1961369 RepID=UPI003168BBA6
MINKGRVLATGTPSQLKEKIPKMKVLSLHVKSNGGDAGSVLLDFNAKFEVKAEERDV